MATRDAAQVRGRSVRHGPESTDLILHYNKIMYSYREHGLSFRHGARIQTHTRRECPHRLVVVLVFTDRWLCGIRGGAVVVGVLDRKASGCR